MEFDELKYIKNTVKRIYDDKQSPKVKEVGNNGISERPNVKVLGSYLYDDKASCLQQIPDDLVAIKGLEGKNELFKSYANIGRKIFNNNRANLYSISRLLEEKLDEFEEAYFMETKPLMKFLIHTEISEKIYSLDAYNYERLASLLCHMNLLGFEKLLKEMEEVLEIFTSYKIGWKINENSPLSDDESAMDLTYPRDNEYLLGVLSRGKRVVLRYYDIEYKLDTINSMLNGGLFDYKKTSISEIKSDGYFLKKITNDLSKKLGNKNEVCSKEKIEEIIAQVAKSTSNNGNSKIENPKTIELYLRNLVKNPLDGIETIQENLDESGVIPNSDADKFPNLKFGTLRGWEKKFFKILEDHCYDKYAQRFKRFTASE